MNGVSSGELSEMEEFEDASGLLWYVHAKAGCKGHCPLHNPSDHPLNAAPILLRGTDLFDIRPTGFVDRLCEHGVGHSDPDSVAFFASKGVKGLGSHGCCSERCCLPTNRANPDLIAHLPL